MSLLRRPGSLESVSSDPAVVCLLTEHLIGCVHEGLIVYDRDLRYRLWNPQMERMSGKSAEDVLGKLPVEVFPWLASTGVMDRLRRALEGEQPEPLEFPFNTQAGAGWCIDTSAPLRDGQGTVVGVVATVQDSTAIHLAQNTLAQSERRFRVMIERSVDAVVVVDAQGRIIYASPNVPTITGFELADRIGRSGFDTIHPADQSILRCAFANVVAAGPGGSVALEFRAIRPDGTVWWAQGRAVNLLDDPDVGGVVINYRDISKQKESEIALRNSEMRLELAVRSSGAGVWDWNVRDNVMLWDDRMFELYGYTREAFPGGVQAWERGLHPEDRARAWDESQAALRGERPFDTEFRIVTPHGVVRHIKADGIVLRDADGQATRMIGLNRDVTERLMADQQRRDDARMIEESQRAARAGWYSLDVAKGIWQSSTQLDQMFGITGSYNRDVAGWLDLVHPDDRAVMLDHFQRHVLQEHHSFDQQYRVVRADDGGVLWVHGRGALSFNAAGQPVMMAGLIQDITQMKAAEAERVRLEDQLRHAQKMEAIGTLAGGVAHDFNNILGGILGGLALLDLELGDRGLVSADVENMKALVQRGADLAKQLLGFGRRGRYDARPLDLAQVARETGEMFGRSRRDVIVDYLVVEHIPAVLMDHAQAEQVLLNLFLNAGQAMPAGGRITVRADATTLGDVQAAALKVESGSFVRMVVADTGMGMDAATKARIFEPFFTTKAPGQGSGLGLASAYGIVRNHGGAIFVDSEPGAGAAFTILLPATNRLPDVAQKAAAVRHVGHGTIMVVDDEAPIRLVCAQLLRRMGYEVLAASGGQEALSLMDTHRDEVSLVILDLTMPGMSGSETFDALRRLHPTVKVLLASGYSAEGQAKKLLEKGCNGFLQKPFDQAALIAKLQELL